ncbi:glycosyltransferase [Patescibacteria group bacterium]|nr:glycosyltransferase [Patescibacteria group bacterium]MBU1256502.1 glycosyltransferase [Patescibacteria group bacterium]MBU1457825.1 glycosyltransferase [Patescibacteria group bacterium]
MKKLTIIFTGGHHNSTLEVALAARKKGYQVIWIGHKFTSREDKSLSAEFKEITKNNIKFLELKTGKVYKQSNPLEYLKIFLGFIQSFSYLIKFKPSLIFSSGGFISVPVVITGWILGIPSITHEQTVTAGWANKALSPFVKKILLTHQSSKKNFPSKKTVVVGLPIRKKLLEKTPVTHFKPKLLYITCGKQGSHVINSSLFPLIPQLVKKYTVVHQTGSNSKTKDISKARRVKKSLGEYSDRYIHAPYFFADQATDYLRSAHLVISRAGAHTTYELCLLGKRVIFIPISWVSHNEQFLNAKLAATSTTSLTLKEKDLNPQALMLAIKKLSPKKLKPVSGTVITNATQRIMTIINEMV